ncbi:MAG: hypothetical protein AB7L09_03325 [Nitrospira sp.]
MTLQTASGPVKIEEIFDRTVRNPDHVEIVFIWTGSRLFFSEIKDFRPLGEEQIFDVVLDDGSTVRVSPSTHFMMRNGDRKTAPELAPGDSLLPLYLEEEYHGYPTYRIPGRDVKQKIYRLMAEWKLGHPLDRGTEVKHLDGNRKNYHPDNLEIKLNARSKVRRRRNKLGRAFQEVNKLLAECAEASPLIAEIAEKKIRRNHKVMSITPGRMGVVYTASVRSVGFVSVSGVFLELPG